MSATKQSQPCDGELWVMSTDYPVEAQQFIDIARDVLNRYGAKQPTESKGPTITLTGAQLLQALDFIAPDRDTDTQQLEGDLTITYGDGHAGKGYYCYCTDCPDEGAIMLDAEAPDAPAAPVSAEPVGKVVLCGGDPDLKEVAWRKGKMPAAGVELFAAPVAAQAQPESAELQESRHDSAHAETEGERVRALAYWLEQQTYEPAMLSCAAATLRALLARAQEQQDATLDSRIAADLAVIVETLDEGEWAEHIAKTDLGQRLEGHITQLIGMQQDADKVDAERYRAWRDALVTGKTSAPDFIRTVADNLPTGVGGKQASDRCRMGRRHRRSP